MKTINLFHHYLYSYKRLGNCKNIENVLMTLKFPVVYIENPGDKEHGAMFNGINNFACSRGLDTTAGSYFFAVYDDNKNIVESI